MRLEFVEITALNVLLACYLTLLPAHITEDTLSSSLGLGTRRQSTHGDYLYGETVSSYFHVLIMLFSFYNGIILETGEQVKISR